jgi:hypothetical protein
MVRIASSSQRPANIESILRSKGAPEDCFTMSEIGSIDARILPLADALQKIVDYQMGTILCCIPGRLAYFENEDDRFIFERKP